MSKHTGIISLMVENMQLDCHYSWSPGRPGKMYLANGDPGYPDEPGELEVTGVELVLPDPVRRVGVMELLEALGAFTEVYDLCEAQFDACFATEGEFGEEDDRMMRPEGWELEGDPT